MRAISCLFLASFAALAQPARTPVKPVPAPGVEVPASDRAELESGLERLKGAAAKLKGNPLLPDVLIYQERDEAFWVGVELSKSRAFLFIESASHATSETRYAPADRPETA